MGHWPAKLTPSIDVHFAKKMCENFQNFVKLTDRLRYKIKIPESFTHVRSCVNTRG